MENDIYEGRRFKGSCPTCGQPFYVEAFEAARAFIDCNVADPDITQKMRESYKKYQEALNRLLYWQENV